jgi:hypothetical protein
MTRSAVEDQTGFTSATNEIPGKLANHTDVIIYPSGASFATATEEEAGMTYADPVDNAKVPLIKLADKLHVRLSPNFTVGNFVGKVGRDYQYARISVDLVRRVQAIQERAQAPLIIVSGYRPPAVNELIKGADQSPHIAGRAADFKISGIEPLEVAALALDEMGPHVGIGLGAGTIHIELREDLKSWVYTGARLSDSEFAAWVHERTQRASI